MSEIRIIPEKPTASGFMGLRRSVGWGIFEEADFQKGLDASLFAVTALCGGELVGMARVVGDGRTVFYIQDVIVHPDYQRRGVGRAMMERIMEHIASAACERAVVGLMAAKGREGFYEQFGFHTRPNDREGAGMMQFWKAPPQPR